jgi:hypothetical protein
LSLHAAAAVARIADFLIHPLPAATMSLVHRLAEVTLTVAAPGSRFSGAELWNVSRHAGPTEFRGQEAVVQFVQSAVLITVSPWRDSIVISPHPNANWSSERIELTPSLDPLLAPAVAVLLVFGWVLAIYGLARRARSALPASPAWMRWSLMTPLVVPSFWIALICRPLPAWIALVVVGCTMILLYRTWMRALQPLS